MSGAVDCRGVWRILLASTAFDLLADAGEDPGAKKLNALEEGLVRHPADVHLQDLPRVAEELAQVQDAVSDLIGPAGEHHPRLDVGRTATWRGHRSADLG